ncbi:hypothetical protein ACJ41O_002559 [Fusarium nematophilum]
MGGQNLPNWIPADTCQSPTSKTGELNPSWQPYPAESPLSTQFAPPFTPVTSSSAGWTSGGSETATSDDMAWGQYAPPVRSMSYGGEPLADHHQHQYPSMSHNRQFERRASALSDVYTSSIGGMVPGFEPGTSASMDPAGPLSTGTIPPANFGSWDQPQPQPGYTYSKNPSVYSGWSYGGGG